MKTIGIILAVIGILVLAGVLFYMGKLIYIAKKTGTADEVRAARKKSLTENDFRYEADRKRIDEVITMENEKAFELSELIRKYADGFTMDWAFRNIENGMGLDGVYDRTGVNWIVLKDDEYLADAVDQYIAIKQYIKENGTSYRAEGAIMWKEDITHLRILSQKAIDSLKGIQGDVFDKCRENNIRIIMESSENCYYDFVEQCEYEVYVGETWPGSVDDAATYGSIELIRRL